MRKVALFLALFFLVDATVDSFDSDCVSTPPAASCHACLCQVPALTPPIVTVQRISAPKMLFVVTPVEIMSDRLTDKRFFQPPKALA